MDTLASYQLASCLKHVFGLPWAILGVRQESRKFRMRLKIVATGGTIDKIYFDANSEYEIGEPLIGRMLHDGGVNFEYEIIPLMQKDSLDLTAEDRDLIREEVLAGDSPYVLITHGTDTMTDTAAALGEIKDRTVVLTGALSPARFQISDAAFNVGLAIGAVQSKPPGVYIAMNGQVFAAAGVRKNRERNRFEEI